MAEMVAPPGWELSKATCCWCQRRLMRETGSVWWCPHPPCAARQTKWGIYDPTGKRWHFLPTPRQTHFAESTAKYTLFAGAAGPGKSHASRWLAYSLCQRIPKARVLLLRETSNELLRSHILGLMDAEAGPIFGAQFRLNPFPLATFANGSFIEGGHMEDAAAVKKYLSSEYDLIIPEEATQYPPASLLELITRARTSNPAMLRLGGARAWLPTNPGGPSTPHLRMLFMDRDLDAIRETWPKLTYTPEQWLYVPATLDDNPYLDPAYEETLGILTQAWRYDQLRHGDWYALPGVYFDHFTPRRHVVARQLVHPERLHWFRSLDWGYHDFGVVLWACVLSDGHLHIAREAKFRQLTPPEVVRAHVRPGDTALGIHGLAKRGEIHTWASPDMWQRRGQVGETLQESARTAGWPLRPAKTERINGWMRLQMLLRDAPDGAPWLTIDPNCKYLIRSLQSAVADRSDPEDVGQHDDHALEAGRYLVMSRPAPKYLPIRQQTGAWDDDFAATAKKTWR